MHMHKTYCFSGELQSSEEGEVFWISLRELQQMDLSEDRKSIIRLFLEDEFSEFRYEREDGNWEINLK